MKESAALTDLVISGIFVSTEAQMLFERRIKGTSHDWNVDFSGTPQITLGDEPEFAGRPHMLGSTDSNYHTFRWGWSPDNSWNAPTVALSQKVRHYGATHSIAELTDPEFSADDDLALRLVIAAKVITGHVFHMPMPVGPATAWMIIDAPELTLGGPAIRPVVKALAAGLTVTDIPNHRTAITEYGRLRGFHAIGHGNDLRILLPDGSADLTFDTSNRLTNCQVTQPLSEEAGAQLAAAGPVEPELENVVIEEIAEVVAPSPVSPPAAEESAVAEGPDDAHAPEAVLPDTDAVEDEIQAVEPEAVEPQVEPEHEPEPTTEGEGDEKATETSAKEETEPKKKKGFFSRLFGR